MSLNRNEIIINNVFSYNILFDIINENEDLVFKFVEKCWHINNWSKLKVAIQIKIIFEVFGFVAKLLFCLADKKIFAVRRMKQ